MTKLFLLLTIALAASACTIYLGTDDDDHGGWLPDAGQPPGDAGWVFTDAGWPAPDAAWPSPDAMPIPGDAGLPWPDAAPIDHDGGCSTP